MTKISKKEQFISAIRNWDHNAVACKEMENLCLSRPDHINFYEWVKQTDWTVGAIVEFFRYQCLYLNSKIDWQEFENYYYCFKSKVYACF